MTEQKTKPHNLSDIFSDNSDVSVAVAFIKQKLFDMDNAKKAGDHKQFALVFRTWLFYHGVLNNYLYDDPRAWDYGVIQVDVMFRYIYEIPKEFVVAMVEVDPEIQKMFVDLQRKCSYLHSLAPDRLLDFPRFISWFGEINDVLWKKFS